MLCFLSLSLIAIYIYHFDKIKIDMLLLAPNDYEYEAVLSGLNDKFKKVKILKIDNAFKSQKFCVFQKNGRCIVLACCGQRQGEVVCFLCNIMNLITQKTRCLLFGICGANKEVKPGTIFFTKEYYVFKHLTISKEKRRHQKSFLFFNDFYFSERNIYKFGLGEDFVISNFIYCFSEKFSCCFGVNVCINAFINNYDFCRNVYNEIKSPICFNTEDGFIKEFIIQNNKNIQFFPVRVVSDNSGYSVHEIDDKGKVLACNTLKEIAPEIVNYFLEVFY